ncbi:MAG: DUF1643 domain-containing protein [Planctomycetaceae bacterium]|nr:DUF1643 domain-containing protein [Planctomycetaceae bacterium]
MRRSARFSTCTEYRYSLSRIWNPSLPRVLFIGLNPSTADDKCDDPTVRRCIGFARSWGFGELILVNLFAYRTTDPSGLTEVNDPIGPENDHWIAVEQSRADRVVAAWGNHGILVGRDKAVLECLDRVYCLGVTKTGCPRHPLYLSADTPLQKFNSKRARQRAA